jgi:predicted O-methyltransferase YrrM
MKLKSLLLPSPVKARHHVHSMLYSPEDDGSQPSPFLIELAADLIRLAQDTDLRDVSARMAAPPHWPDQWPGEHYRLLAALVRKLQPRTVIEVGTFTGLSCLSMQKFLPPGGRLTTFDLVHWDAVKGSCLRAADFEDGRLVQVLGDLGDPQVFRRHGELLAGAGLFFVDGPKDKVFEPRFLANLATLRFAQPPVLVFDDIRTWNMLAIWRGIRAPKLDITSFGHWTGTGLVHWVE